MSQEKVLAKLELLFKEEQWGRIEPKDIGISKFKILDDLFNSIVSDELTDQAEESCRQHLAENPDSITGIYLQGLLGYHNDRIDEALQLRKLIDVFINSQKWAVVEIIAEKILEYGENSVALRAMAVSLERLGRSKEAIPVLEDLLKIDRFDTEVAKKLAYALLEKDRAKSVYYMKLAIEGFIKNKNFDEIIPLWNKLIPISEPDVPFYERVERMLVDAKQPELAATLLKTLLNITKEAGDLDECIEILKKILLYRPEDSQMRRDLVKFYRDKYGEHSQFDQFLKLSKLNNFKTPVKFAIQDFENYIIFDVGHYAFHNSWKLGKIKAMDSESITIDFKDNEDHKMSIKMALQSLTPISDDHLYVVEYEDAEGLKKMFSENFLDFFEILIKSYGGEIHLADIKFEIISKYIEEKSWAKWWNKARTQIKKSPIFGVSDKKKDLFFMRDKPVTYVDELLDKFLKTDSFSVKLDIAIEFANNIDEKDGSQVVQFLIDYFTDETKGSSNTRLILSYIILVSLGKKFKSKLKLDSVRDKVLGYIKTSNELPIMSMKISSYDYKKDLVSLIEEAREDWPHVVAELLFETPIRIHRYIINTLIRAHAYNVINTFIERVITGAKQYPEIFMWIAKNLFNRLWDYEWLDYSRRGMRITFFRLMNDLKKIELDGNRLKNMAIELLFGAEAQVLRDIVQEGDEAFLGRAYDVFSNLSFVEDSQKEKFLALIKEKFSDFKIEQHQAVEVPEQVIEKLIVTQHGLDRKQAELENMVSVELPQLSKELSKVSEKSADPRENAEYNALLERQAIMEMSISKLREEMKGATILDAENINAESVSVGTRVGFVNVESGESGSYTILGPWDADFEKHILSYRSPIAREMLGKKKDEEFSLHLNESGDKFRIVSIEKYTA